MNDVDPTERLRRSFADRGPGPDLPLEVVAGAPARSAPRLADPRRRAQAAGGAVLALAAVTAGALAFGSLPRGPLFTAASSGAVGLHAAEDAATADLRIGHWTQVEYVPGPALGTEGGSGTVYQLRLAGSAQAVLERAAAVLGVEGRLTESSYSDPADRSYVIGPEDGSAPSVTITWNGTGNWWFSDPGAYPPLECGAADSGDDAGPEACVMPEPRLEDSLAPSEAEARAFAQRLFAATGLEAAAGSIRVTADPWQTVAAANLQVAGIDTALEWTVAWSALTGKIAWATGHSVEVVNRGEYGTVSATDAVGRLADWRWYGAPGPDHMDGAVLFATDAVALRAQETADAQTQSDGADAPGEEPPASGRGEPGTEEPGGGEPGEVPAEEPADPGADPEAPVEGPTEEPLPEPEPEVVVVTVDRAERTLLLLWDADGSAWLVPGFAFQHPDGWWNAVVSLVEGVIALPEPMEIEPLIID